MTIHRGDCSHIKSHWDNHKICIKCSHCSRKSTCSTCSSWSISIGNLQRRTYSSRKWIMAKKKKKRDEEINYGNTAPHGPAARGKTHKGGNSLGTCTQGSTSPLATVQRSPIKEGLKPWLFFRQRNELWEHCPSWPCCLG